MKVRQGFVSNSSSSSFVVAVDGEPKVNLEIDLSELGYVCTTKEELDTAYVKVFGWRQQTLQQILEERDGEEYRKALQAIQTGKTVVLGNISNDSGNELKSLVYYQGLPADSRLETIYGDV